MTDWKMLRKTYEMHPEMNLRALADRFHVNYSTVRQHKARKHWKRRTVTSKTMADDLIRSGLTGKQQLFCAYYLKSYDAVQSYRRAYKCKLSTAETNADRLLRNGKVQAELSKLHKQQVSYMHIDRSDVLRKMIQEYFGANLSKDIYFSNKDDKGREHARAYPHLKDHVSNLEELSFGHGQTHLKLPNMERLGEFLWQVLPAPAKPAKDDSLIRAFELGMKKYGNGRDGHDEN